MDPVLLTVPEVARALRIGRTKVFNLVIAGEIDSVKIGKLRRIPVSAVYAYTKRLARERETC